MLISNKRVNWSAQFSQQGGMRAKLLSCCFMLAIPLEEGATTSGMIKFDSSNYSLYKTSFIARICMGQLLKRRYRLVSWKKNGEC
jgi:hypothetical protein